MRNLKRALSLTLASVMLLGMMVLGTSAASYPDVTDEHNVEAIEVLQAIGVMSGSNNGNFNPDSKVTRIEMAIVMANLLDLDVGYFQGQNTFSDVPEWASGYVNACAASGIVTGVGGGRFGTGNVTATQAALMMLKALGYFQYNSDFGDNWARATALQAAKINLFDGLNVQDNTQLTRNQVAQLALNTLEKPVMDAVDNTLHITTGETAGNINITGGQVTYVARSSKQPFAKAIDDKESSGNSDSNISGYTIELGEQLYNGDLKKDDTAGDDFGRPATKWTYKNDEVGTYATAARATFVGKVSQDTLYNTIGRSIVTEVSKNTASIGSTTVSATVANNSGFATNSDDPAKMSVYMDGTSTVQAIGDWAERNDDSAAGKSGNGVITEVYVDEYDNVIVAQHAIYVMQATNNYNSNKDTLSVTMRTRPDGVTRNVTTLDGRDFDLTGFANEDYLLYTWAKNEVQSVVKAEPLTGVVNSYSSKTKSGGAAEDFGKAGGWVKLDEQKYNYAKFASTSLDNGCGVEYGVGETAAVVLDGHNNVLWVDNKAISTGNYLYVSKIVTGSRLGSTLIAEANFTDGTKAEITVARINDRNRNKQNSDVENDATSNWVPKYNGWYSYSKNDSNEYTLTAAASNAVVSYKTANGASTKVVNNDKVSFLSDYAANAVTNTSTLAGNLANVTAGETAIRGNSNTIFVVKDQDGDIKAYTGIAALPDISTSETNGDLLNVVYMKNNDSTDSNTKYASLVYIDAGSAKSIDDANNAYDLMFLLKKDHTYNDGNEKINVWKAVVNGEEATVESKVNYTGVSALIAGAEDNNNGMYYKVKADSKNYVSATAFATSNAYVKGNLGAVSYSGGTLILGNGGEFTAPSDAQYTLITYAPEMQKDQTTDTGYEVYTGLTADSLNSTLNAQKWILTGEWYAVKTSSSSDTLKSLYVVVRSVAAGRLFEGNTDATDIEKALEEGPVRLENVNLTGTLSVDKDENVTLAGTTTGTITTTGNGSVTLDNATVSGTLNLSGNVTGDVTVPANQNLVLDENADVDVAVEADGNVAVPKNGSATITFADPQTKPVTITGLEETDLWASGDAMKTSIAEMFPDGGEVDLDGMGSDAFYNPDWGMVNLAVPAGTGATAVAIYNSDGDLVALATGKGTVGQARDATVIGLTTKPLNKGCFEWALGNGGDNGSTPTAVDLAAGETYTYVVYESAITWGVDTLTVEGNTNYKNAGTFDDSNVILTGTFVAE